MSMAAQEDLSKFIRDTKNTRDNQADVSLAIGKHLLLNYGKDSNLVFSPISLQIILSLLAAGSSGRTLKQLLSFLKAKTTDDLNYLYSYLVDHVFVDGSISGGPCLSLANGAWVDESLSLKHSFKQVVDTLYKAASHQVDFQKKFAEARHLVNSWVEKETNGLIKEILPSNALSTLTRLVFANALYFKGEWMYVFDADYTKDYDFYFLNGDSVQVPFMRMWDRQYISVFDGFKVLMLPYDRKLWSDDEQGWNYTSIYDKKRQFSMYIFLPDAKDGLPALIEKAGSESGFLERHIPNKLVDVGDFRIPKFKFEYQIEVSEALKTLGLVLPFDEEADLSEMVDAPIRVSKIYHKSFIEVKEAGTEAAAATVAVCELVGSLGVEEIIKKVLIDFVADHPFLFFIREDKTGMVLFIGHVLNPSTTSSA